MSSLITAFPYSFVYIKDWSRNEIPTRATSIDRKKNYLRKAFQKKKRKIKSIIQIILTYVHTYTHTYTHRMRAQLHLYSLSQIKQFY